MIQRWIKTGFLALLLFTFSIGLSAARWSDTSTINLTYSELGNGTLISALPPGNAVTNGEDLLRYALPIDNDEIRQVQKSLENIAEELRAKRWSSISKEISNARRVVQRKRDRILASVPERNKTEAANLLDQIETSLDDLDAALETQDKGTIWLKRRAVLTLVGNVEEDMVDGFPFEVPEEFSNLPQLKGRATVEMGTTKGVMTIVLDGYNAPVSAGNFLDLVQRGFYDGLPIIRVMDNFIVQTGDPEGDAAGFIDPNTGEYRAVPLEIMVRGDEEPIYSFTLESIGRYLDEPALPFSALGAVAIARPVDDPNGGSSQIFFQLYDPEVTPAGRNMLDGRYAAFGYVVENPEILKDLTTSDRIEYAKVIDGAENLVQPQS